MTSAQVVETSVTKNSSTQNYPHSDDYTIRTIEGSPGLKRLWLKVGRWCGTPGRKTWECQHVGLGDTGRGVWWTNNTWILRWICNVKFSVVKWKVLCDGGFVSRPLADDFWRPYSTYVCLPILPWDPWEPFFEFFTYTFRRFPLTFQLEIIVSICTF